MAAAAVKSFREMSSCSKVACRLWLATQNHPRPKLKHEKMINKNTRGVQKHFPFHDSGKLFAPIN